MAPEEKIKWMIRVSTTGFIIGLLAIYYERHIGLLGSADFLIGASTFFLGFVTLYLAFTQLNEGRINRNQDRELAARERAISNYPLLSQKIDVTFPEKNLYVNGMEVPPVLHYILKIKNYGKGPAINQDRVYYRFFQSGNKGPRNHIPITGAHDIISPGDERPLNMNKLECSLNRNDWDPDIEKKYDTIWVRLPHEDIQRNECCNCTKYEYFPRLKGRWGKIERHWYFASYPEISSDGCEECDWRAG